MSLSIRKYRVNYLTFAQNVLAWFYRFTWLLDYIYSMIDPLQTINDYDLYAQSLRNHKEFYANIAWSPLDSHGLQEEYVLVEHKVQMQGNEEYVLLSSIELDSKIINRVLGWCYKRITGKEFPLEECYLYKRVKRLTLAKK